MAARYLASLRLQDRVPHAFIRKADRRLEAPNSGLGRGIKMAKVDDRTWPAR